MDVLSCGTERGPPPTPVRAPRASWTLRGAETPLSTGSELLWEEAQPGSSAASRREGLK